MLNILASHNDDIKQLLDKGYAVSIDSKCLVIRDIPYLGINKELKWGAFVSKLIFVDNNHVRLEDHQVFFCGSHPCELDGQLIRNLGGGPCSYPLRSPDLKVQRSFSNKPSSGFSDLFDKIESYTNIISGPAIELYGVNPYTCRSIDTDENSVFKFHDTLTSRAEIGDLTENFHDDVIAVVGLGGTGAYILDFLAKTPVKEIRGFDADYFHVHNAYRSPGKLEENELGKKKAEVYQKRYESFRHGVSMNTKVILAHSIEELQGVTFAFVCVDKGSSRGGVFEALMCLNIPFIDVGIGLDKHLGPISGQVRTTYFEKDKAQEMLSKGFVPLNDVPDDIYHTNIQISELNALNACLAVIRYKQLRGFYATDEPVHQLLFTLDGIQLNRE